VAVRHTADQLAGAATCDISLVGQQSKSTTEGSEAGGKPRHFNKVERDRGRSGTELDWPMRQCLGIQVVLSN
jgi:hypothetical protein